MKNGFSLHDVKHNLTEQQLRYYYDACLTSRVQDINDSVMAYARVMAGEESQKQIDKELKRLSRHLENKLEFSYGRDES